MRLRGGEVTPAVSFFIWGAQLETGSVATSPIYTVASTVARTADNITLTSASSLIGQTEGRIKTQFQIGTQTTPTINRNIIQLYTGDETNAIILRVADNNSVQLVVLDNSSVEVVISSAAGLSGIIDAEVSYAANSYSLTVNGVLAGTDTSATVPSMNTIALATNETAQRQLNGNMRYFALFPTSA
jgi:hypothetical protein